MNPNQALWEKGDFTRIAESMRDSGEAVVLGLGVIDGLRVLDLGCGDGTTAIPAARVGADVLGVDIARNLVAAGNARARAQGLTNCTFRHGDASDLHDLDDDSFDLVVSIFGAMFAPRPFDVANEMVRVTRPGGRIVMGNWIPNDPTLVLGADFRNYYGPTMNAFAAAEEKGKTADLQRELENSSSARTGIRPRRPCLRLSCGSP